MSERTLALLFVVFLVVAGLYFFSAHERHQGARSLLTALGNSSWKEADTVEVFFREPKQGFRLVKREGRWLVEDGYPRPAKGEEVERLLSDLADLYGERRARGESYFARFRVTEEDALHLVLRREGQVLGHLLLGKRGPRWESGFVRPEGAEDIYLVPVNLLSRFGIWKEDPEEPKDKDWVDLKVGDLSPAELKELALTWRGSSWRLVREEDGFRLRRGQEEREVPEERVRSLLAKVFPLVAERVVPPAEGFAPEGRLTWETKLGTRVVLELGPCAEVKTGDQGKKGKGGEKGKKDKERKLCRVRRGGFTYEVAGERLAPLLAPELGE